MRRYEHNPRPEIVPTEGIEQSPFFKTQVHLSYSKSEDIVNQALRNALYGRSPQPQRELFPPRTGYERGEYTVEDVLQTNRFMGRDMDRRWDYSGSQGRYGGTPRYGYGWW